MIKRIGIDFHKVIDKLPKFFSYLTESLIKDNWEVYIITGSHKKDIIQEVTLYNIHYTEILSILDYHTEKGTKIEYDSNGNRWIKKEIWDGTKATFCEELNIMLHLDDTSDYGKYFKTDFCHFLIRDK